MGYEVGDGSLFEKGVVEAEDMAAEKVLDGGAESFLLDQGDGRLGAGAAYLVGGDGLEIIIVDRLYLTLLVAIVPQLISLLFKQFLQMIVID